MRGMVLRISTPVSRGWKSIGSSPIPATNKGEMLKVLVHFARHSENGLERRHADLQRQSEALHRDASSHVDFLNEALIELQARMARTRTVQENTAKLLAVK
jgi:hypothetical protein